MSDPNEPAFPCPEFSWRDGMTIRTYLAGQALAGIMSNLGYNSVNRRELAECSVSVADALIDELNKNKEKK